MLYKVTPMLTPTTPKAKPAETSAPGTEKVPRKRRKSAVFDADGNEVLITMMCLKCRSMKPLAMFGLRKMADGAIRNQPWCRTCRSGASPKKKKDDVDSVEAAVPVENAVPAEVVVQAEAAAGSSAAPVAAVATSEVSPGAENEGDAALNAADPAHASVP